METISATKLKTQLHNLPDGTAVLDVRTLEEVKERSIAGALHIPLSELQDRYEELREFKRLYVMCRSGGRSEVAAQLLNAAGVADAWNVTGGILELDPKPWV